MNEDEVEVVIDIRADGSFQARALHRASGTIKISDVCDSKEEAIKDATEGLALLVQERIKGLGEKKPSS